VLFTNSHTVDVLMLPFLPAGLPLQKSPLKRTRRGTRPTSASAATGIGAPAQPAAAGPGTAAATAADASCYNLCSSDGGGSSSGGKAGCNTAAGRLRLNCPTVAAPAAMTREQPQVAAAAAAAAAAAQRGRVTGEKQAADVICILDDSDG
jgi:hypothetical protein